MNAGRFCSKIVISGKFIRDALTDFGLSIWKDKVLLFIVLLINFLAYFPFLAETIYTNHSFPNLLASFYEYPSYRTIQEHRFAQDFLMMLQGAPGNAFLCLLFSLVLQVLNAFLAVKLFRFSDRVPKLIFCLFVSLYPYIWDYYGFSTDHLSFVVGDTLVLLAFFTVGRRSFTWCFAGIVLLLLSLGFYPGKLSLMGTLGLLYILKNIKDYALDDGDPGKFLRNVSHVVFIVLGGALLYLVSLKVAQHYYIPMVAHNSARLSIGSFHECWGRLGDIYRRTWYFWVGWGQGNWFVFKPFLAFLLFITSLGGLFSILVSIFKIKCKNDRWKEIVLYISFFVFVVMLLPVALNATAILNKEAAGFGRFLFQWAYFWAFMISLFYGSCRWVNYFIIFIISLCCYFFVLIHNDIFKICDIRNKYDWSFINRVAQRVEPFLENGKSYQLLIFGHPASDARFRGISHNISEHLFSSVNICLTMIPHYRRNDYLEFLLLNNKFNYPKRSVANSYLEKLRGMPVWPAEGCVQVDGDMILIRLSDDVEFDAYNAWFSGE